MNAPMIAGMVFIVFSLYLLKQSLASYKLAKVSKTWPCVVGELVSFEVSKPKANSHHRVLYVSYTYQVDGDEYLGSQDAFYTLLGDEILALELQFQASNQVRVFYKPDAPATSTLIVGNREGKAHSDIILASTGVLVGALLLLAGYAGFLS